MANLIKNQILKHLSKFAKNLSHDQINVSTLKGEGELRNLELNDELLTELLELPSWLRLSRATCNRVTVRIQWTKLKSVPIHLSLDEVRVEVATCETLRTVAGGSGGKMPVQENQYGFVDKVVDGITVTVNSVHITLHSRVFTASFQMSRIVLESKSPTWQKTDLRMTRIKDTDKGEVLNFKEVSWQTVRIEAKSTVNEELTPLRLITNQSRCRITIKKKMSDCSVLGCRLVLILDDLLWVLTDDQLKAALHFADSLSGLLKRATLETQKVKGARKLESLAAFHKKSKDPSKSKKKGTSDQGACAAAKVFARYDVVETSYHFYSDRIDLHLCDDPGGKGRSCHPGLANGGAFQISLSQLQIDFYPYHLAAGNRAAWIRYTESVHATWLQNGLDAFQATLLHALTSGSIHAPLSRSGATKNQAINGEMRSLAGCAEDAAIKENILSQFKKLLTANLVVRLANFSMWKVSTSKGKTTPREFITAIDKPPLAAKARKKSSGERERFSLPDDMPVMHFEYTQFYYPGGIDFPIPPPKVFAYINPIQLSLDPLTVLWLNAFSLNLQQSVKMLAIEQTEPPYLDVKVEAIMFRIMVDAPDDAPRQRDRPQALHLQISRILAANYRSLETGSKADLARVLEQFQKSQLFFGTEFPNYPNDIPTVCDKLLQHATEGDTLQPTSQPKKLDDSSSREDIWKMMKKDLLWTEAKDVWYLYLDPVWADFHGTPAVGSRPVPLIDAFPVGLWLYKQPDMQPTQATNISTEEKTHPQQAKMHIIGTVNSLISVQLNHYQLLFLMRMIEMISEITTFLTQDVRHILGEEDEGSVAVGFLAPQVDASLLMPSVSQSRDAIGGDYESVVPDTTSIYSGGNLFKGREKADDSVTDDTTMPSNSLMASTSDLTLSVDPSDDLQDSSSRQSTPVPQQQQQQQQQPETSRTENVPSPSLSGACNTIPETATPNLAMASPASQPKTPTKQNRQIPAINVNSPATGNRALQVKKHSLTSSLTNMMSSLDASLRGTAPTMHAAASASNIPSPAGDEDNISIRSDGSSDSESYIIISQASDIVETRDAALFQVTSKRESPVEIATEVTEDDFCSPSPQPIPGLSGRAQAQAAQSSGQARSCTPIRQRTPQLEPQPTREGMISVATFHLGGLALAQQSVGSHACIKLQGSSISGEECPSISWDEFQSKFTMRSKGWSESTLQPPASWCFKMRFSTRAPKHEDLLRHANQAASNSEEPGCCMSLREKIARSAEAFLELRAQNLPLQFYMSTLNGLGDLVEDEIIPTPIPMKDAALENADLNCEDLGRENSKKPLCLACTLEYQRSKIIPLKIRLDNIALHLIEDRPSPNITSPGHLPIDVAIPALTLTRDKSGLFSVQPAECFTDRSESVAAASLPDIKKPSASMTHHLDLVRSGVASIETELQQRASLLAVDNSNLRSLLDNANAEVLTLRKRIAESEAMAKRMAKMQSQLLATEKENKSLKQTLKYLQGELVKAGKKV